MLPRATLKVLRRQRAVGQALSSGRLDAGIMSMSTANQFLMDFGNLRVLDGIMVREPLAFAVAPNAFRLKFWLDNWQTPQDRRQHAARAGEVLVLHRLEERALRPSARGSAHGLVDRLLQLAHRQPVRGQFAAGLANTLIAAGASLALSVLAGIPLALARMSPRAPCWRPVAGYVHSCAPRRCWCRSTWSITRCPC